MEIAISDHEVFHSDIYHSLCQICRMMPLSCASWSEGEIWPSPSAFRYQLSSLEQAIWRVHRCRRHHLISKVSSL